MRLLISLILSIPLSVILSQQIKYENSVPALLQETRIRKLIDFSVDGQANYYLLDGELKQVWVYDKDSKLLGELPEAGSTIKFEQPAAIELTSNNVFLPVK